VNQKPLRKKISEIKLSPELLQVLSMVQESPLSMLSSQVRVTRLGKFFNFQLIFSLELSITSGDYSQPTGISLKKILLEGCSIEVFSILRSYLDHLLSSPSEAWNDVEFQQRLLRQFQEATPGILDRGRQR